MRNREHAESAAAAWIAKQENGEWTQADQAALEGWIASCVDNRVAWLRLSAAWEETQRLRTLRTEAPAGAVPKPDELLSPFFTQDDSRDAAAPRERHKSRYERRARRSPKARYYALTASVLLICATAAIWKFLLSTPAYETGIGAIEAVPLPDGSRVTLNTDTRIRVDLGENEREVSLTHGEAYFEVAKDPTRPFVVKVGDKRVVAIGTSFSVRRAGDDVRVFVTEGTVRVEQSESGNTARSIAQLKAGSIAHALAGDVIVQTRPVTEVEQLLTWRTGYLVFDHTPMIEAIGEFNRYNRRRIVIVDPQVARIRIGGSFRATNVEAFLRLVESDFPIEVSEQGDQIILRGATSTEK